MELKAKLDLITSYASIKKIRFNDNGDLLYVELHQSVQSPPTTDTQIHSIPIVDEMPSDDIMLFAATEDIDELVKQKKII